MKKLFTCFFVLTTSSFVWALPQGFVYLDEMTQTSPTQLRYFSSNNFLGRPVHGYDVNRVIMTRPAALALANVQSELNSFGLGVLIFDAYRPQQAVNDFVQWAADTDDIKTKPQYYPNIEKRDLFKEGYIAEKSGHSRGSTIDLTIVELGKDSKPLDMGSNFDYFGPQSWPNYADISSQQKANRLLLRAIMMKHGFIPYEKEWWHFTLQDEPYPDKYFDFLVQ
jgi:D-alanyl-D-alanine dipeptidase